ncbi:formyl transferase [Robiginitalea sp. IMCC44478]|uniref:formyl transferase n=1 Tax=Robiginitalea sp. IMCC44478 TaxID=3459122 RepID=UPI0040433026
MRNLKIVFFTGGGQLPNIVYNHINEKFQILGIVFDSPGSKTKLLKRRINRLGIFKVVSQLVFMKLAVPYLKWESRSRRKQLLKPYKLISFEKLNNAYIPPSINDISVCEYVNSLNPDVVVVCGTRLISKRIITNINCPMINMHVGITPKYRGVHGGYWALVKDDLENCGVTVHLVDPGIDTGGVISQRTISPTKKDNFVTYPILQAIKGVKCIEDALKQITNGGLSVIDKNLTSKLYYHPTIWTYLYYRLFKGIK